MIHSKVSLSAVFSFLLISSMVFFPFISTKVKADEAITLVFSAIPDQDESRLKARFSKVADYLTRTLEVPVKYVPVKSYAAAVTGFRNNQV